MTDETSAQSSSGSDNKSDPESCKASEKSSATQSDKNDESSSETDSAPPEAQSLREPFPFARLFLTIMFGVIASFAFWLIIVLALLQFATIAIAGQKNDELQHFSRLMGRFIREVFDFMTLASDERPFPLGPFPKE